MNMKFAHRISYLGFLPALILGMFSTNSLLAAGPPMNTLKNRIDYEYVGHLGQRDDAGRLLVWQGTIEGDINGTMMWWFGAPPVPGIVFNGGRVGYYGARWEIWDGDVLLLAGESSGKTVIPDGEDGIWDGHGVVTEAAESLNTLKGLSIYETGPVIFSTFSGTGLFLIY